MSLPVTFIEILIFISEIGGGFYSLGTHFVKNKYHFCEILYIFVKNNLLQQKNEIQLFTWIPRIRKKVYGIYMFQLVPFTEILIYTYLYNIYRKSMQFIFLDIHFEKNNVL